MCHKQQDGQDGISWREELRHLADDASIDEMSTATPFRVSAARQIPLQFREPAEACVKELLAKNVITSCHEPTEWCSPALFVAKPEGKKEW